LLVISLPLVGGSVSVALLAAAGAELGSVPSAAVGGSGVPLQRRLTESFFPETEKKKSK
jgi:hypothetical protein